MANRKQIAERLANYGRWFCCCIFASHRTLHTLMARTRSYSFIFIHTSCFIYIDDRRDHDTILHVHIGWKLLVARKCNERKRRRSPLTVTWRHCYGVAWRGVFILGPVVVSIDYRRLACKIFPQLVFVLMLDAEEKKMPICHTLMGKIDKKMSDATHGYVTIVIIAHRQIACSTLNAEKSHDSHWCKWNHFKTIYCYTLSRSRVTTADGTNDTRWCIYWIYFITFLIYILISWHAAIIFR